MASIAERAFLVSISAAQGRDVGIPYHVHWLQFKALTNGIPCYPECTY